MSVNNPAKTCRKYDASFQQDVLQIVSSGRPASELARAIGVSTSQIHPWVHKSSVLTDPSVTSNACELSYSKAMIVPSKTAYLFDFYTENSISGKVSFKLFNCCCEYPVQCRGLTYSLIDPIWRSSGTA